MDALIKLRAATPAFSSRRLISSASGTDHFISEKEDFNVRNDSKNISGGLQSGLIAFLKGVISINLLNGGYYEKIWIWIGELA
jgi:hypothetical protein